MERDALTLHQLVMFIIPFKAYYCTFNIIIILISQFSCNKESHCSHPAPQTSFHREASYTGVLSAHTRPLESPTFDYESMSPCCSVRHHEVNMGITLSTLKASPWDAVFKRPNENAFMVYLYRTSSLHPRGVLHQLPSDLSPSTIHHLLQAIRSRFGPNVAFLNGSSRLRHLEVI